MNAIGTPRWDLQSQSWVEPERTLAGPVSTESADTQSARPATPSEPDTCRHDRFSIGRGKFKCCHCNQIFDFGEDGL